MPKFGQSLSVKLFAILAIVVGVGFGVYGQITVRQHTTALMNQIKTSADRLAHVLHSATHLGMLRNQREDVRQIIQTIGEEPGVDGIRIYNKMGEIIVSTNADEQHTRVDLQAEECVVCHSGEGALTTPRADMRHRIIRQADGHRTLALISPIRNQPVCSDAPCHAHPADKELLGVFDVRMSLRDVDRILADSRNGLVTWSVLFAFFVAAGSGTLVWLFVHRPVHRLTKGTEELAAGNLDYRIPETSHDEIGRLARDFNRMTAQLAAARHELQQWANTLETRVEEKSSELERIHVNMVQMEKLASLGRLAATVAHELNNPLSGINTYVSLGLRRLKKQDCTNHAISETIKELQFIHDEIDRCGKIVRNLLLFSRNAPMQTAPVAVGDIVEHCTQLIDHHLKLHDIALHVDYDEHATIYGDVQQLRQAMVAVLMNAVEAMPNGGELTISGKDLKVRQMYELTISDTGRGIPEKDLPHIFEPFFSSKPSSSGVGLGLSVVYGIVQRHRGEIEVDSTPGHGTHVRIRIPCHEVTDHKSEYHTEDFGTG
ncbi:MAG: ATP-binding protein [Candidatus Zixiibacteriota bacterium]